MDSPAFPAQSEILGCELTGPGQVERGLIVLVKWDAALGSLQPEVRAGWLLLDRPVVRGGRLLPLAKPGMGARQRHLRGRILGFRRSPDQGDGLGPEEVGNQPVVPVVLGPDRLEDLVNLGIRGELVHVLLGLRQPGLGLLGVTESMVGHRQEEPIGDQERVGLLAQLERLIEALDRLAVAMGAVEQMSVGACERELVLARLQDLLDDLDQSGVIVNAIFGQPRALEDRHDHARIRGSGRGARGHDARCGGRARAVPSPAGARRPGTRRQGVRRHR